MISRYLISLVLTGATVAANAASSVQYLQSHPSQVSGPNCFNSALFATGMTDKIQYTSDVEFSFYIKNFCQPKSDARIEVGDVVTFQSSREFVHAAVAINSSDILEKDSLNGVSGNMDIADPHPGQYVVRKLNESLYGEIKSEGVFGVKYQQTIYSCRPDKVAAILKTQTKPVIEQQLKLRTAISSVLKSATEEVRNGKVKSVLLPLMKRLSLQSIMNSGLGSSFSNHYFVGLIRSNMYQIYLLACGKSIEQTGECYNPRMTPVIQEQSRIFYEIYNFEEKFVTP